MRGHCLGDGLRRRCLRWRNLEVRIGDGRKPITVSIEMISLEHFYFEFSSLANGSLSRGLFIFTSYLCPHSNVDIASSKLFAS